MERERSSILLFAQIQNVDSTAAIGLAYGLEYGDVKVHVRKHERLLPGEVIDVEFEVSPHPFRRFADALDIVKNLEERDPARPFRIFGEFRNRRGSARRFEIPLVMPAPQYDYIERVEEIRYFVEGTAGWLAAI